MNAGGGAEGYSPPPTFLSPPGSYAYACQRWRNQDFHGGGGGGNAKYDSAHNERKVHYIGGAWKLYVLRCPFLLYYEHLKHSDKKMGGK